MIELSMDAAAELGTAQGQIAELKETIIRILDIDPELERRKMLMIALLHIEDVMHIILETEKHHEPHQENLPAGYDRRRQNRPQG